jgi:hypothetical protein
VVDLVLQIQTLRDRNVAFATRIRATPPANAVGSSIMHRRRSRC